MGRTLKLRITQLSSLFFILILFFPHKNLAQRNVPIDVAKIDQQLLNSIYLKLLNVHRDSLNLSPLIDNSTLMKAAQCQSEYMAKTNILSHNQPIPAKASPMNRINYVGGTFEVVGENVLYVPIYIPFILNNYDYRISTYEELAYAMFQSWRHSPGHYKNMISKNFDQCGLFVTYNSKQNKVYATNVFGGKEFKESDLYPKFFDAKNIAFDVNGKYKLLASDVFSVSVANFVYNTFISTRFYHDEIEKVKKVIANKNDGFMVDYVLREQFTCTSRNILNPHIVYDGYPQQPIYQNRIFSNNASLRNDELNVELCVIPKEFINKKIQPNIVILKNNIAINYTTPLTVLSANFRTLNFLPIIDTFDLEKIDTVLKFNYEKRIYFEKATSNPIKYTSDVNAHSNSIPLPEHAKLSSISIAGFSSIEGDSLKNISLQKNRRDTILKIIEPYLSKNEIIISSAKENTTDFIADFKQFVNSSDTSLLALKKVYELHKSEISDMQLSYHRYSKLNCAISVPLNLKSSSSDLNFIYKHLEFLDYSTKLNLLKIILYKLRTTDDILIEANDYEWLNNKRYQLPISFYSTDKTQLEKYYKENLAKKNWIDKDYYNFVIANFKYYEFYQKPFIPFNELSGIIKKLTPKVVTDHTKNLIWLNFYLIKLIHSHKEKKHRDFEDALDNFKKLYFTFDPDVEDIIKIGLFFNFYNKFDLTINLLRPKLALYPNHEELWFVMLSTYTFLYSKDFDYEFLVRLIDKCIVLNKNRFCKYVNDENFQLLRDVIYKNKYCKICEGIEVTKE